MPPARSQGCRVPGASLERFFQRVVRAARRTLTMAACRTYHKGYPPPTEIAKAASSPRIRMIAPSKWLTWVLSLVGGYRDVVRPGAPSAGGEQSVLCSDFMPLRRSPPAVPFVLADMGNRWVQSCSQYSANAVLKRPALSIRLTHRSRVLCTPPVPTPGVPSPLPHPHRLAIPPKIAHPAA